MYGRCRCQGCAGQASTIAWNLLLPLGDAGGQSGGGQSTNASASGRHSTAIRAIGFVENDKFGPWTQWPPAAGVHGPDGRVNAQRVPTQRGSQVQRAGATGYEAIGGGDEADKLRQCELAGKVTSQKRDVFGEPSGEFLALGGGARDEYAVTRRVQ